MQLIKTIRVICAIGALTLTISANAQHEPGEHESAVVTQQPEPGAIINTMCPVTTDEEVDPSFTIEYQGQKIGFCCKKCRTRFEGDPQAYLNELPMLASVSMAGQEDHAHDEGSHTEVMDDGHEHAESAEMTDHDDAQAHDHATGHGDPNDFKLLPYLGRFHILVIHFPIALLVVGGFFEFIGMIRRRTSMESIVRAMVALGALSSVIAVALGLMNAIEAEYAGKLVSVLWWHRALGIALMVVALITWVLIEKRAKMEPGAGFMPARVAVFASAALVGVTAHFGGSLVYGWTYLFP